MEAREREGERGLMGVRGRGSRSGGRWRQTWRVHARARGRCQHTNRRVCVVLCWGWAGPCARVGRREATAVLIRLTLQHDYMTAYSSRHSHVTSENRLYGHLWSGNMDTGRRDCTQVFFLFYQCRVSAHHMPLPYPTLTIYRRVIVGYPDSRRYTIPIISQHAPVTRVVRTHARTPRVARDGRHALHVCRGAPAGQGHHPGTWILPVTRRHTRK